MGWKNDCRAATRRTLALLLLGAAFMPAAAQVVKRAPPSPTANPATVVAPAQKLPTPPPQGGGVAQLNPDAACVSNATPRISNINGTQSGIVFQPGSQLNIVGCGFGNSGQAYLSGGGTTVQLKIESWGDSKIRAQIEPAVGGLQDFGGVKVNVKPNGLPVISSIETHSFKAARAQFVMAIPPGAVGTYSNIYGAPKISSVGSYSQTGGTPTTSGNTRATGSVAGPRAPALAANSAVFTRVSRAQTYPGGFCPAVSDQPSQMTDSWRVDFLANGFDVDSVNYTNETDAKTWDTQKVQWVAVGNGGTARYDAMQKRVFATFQGSSVYVKKGGTLETIMLPTILVNTLMDSGSACTSSYTLSLTVSGPRGLSPFK